jgi:hypothetical protein
LLRDSFEAVGREALGRDARKKPPMTDEEYVPPHFDRNDAVSRGKKELAKFSATVVIAGSITVFAFTEARGGNNSEAEQPPLQPIPQCPTPPGFRPV